MKSVSKLNSSCYIKECLTRNWTVNKQPRLKEISGRWKIRLLALSPRLSGCKLRRSISASCLYIKYEAGARRQLALLKDCKHEERAGLAPSRVHKSAYQDLQSSVTDMSDLCFNLCTNCQTVPLSLFLIEDADFL